MLPINTIRTGTDSFVFDGSEVYSPPEGIKVSGGLPTNTIRTGSDIFAFKQVLLNIGTNVYNILNNSLNVIGTLPVTQDMFDTYGLTSASDIPANILNTNGLKLLVKSYTSDSVNLKYNGTPLPKLVLAKNDITLSNETSNMDKFILTATSNGTGVLKVITSFDSGTTWESYVNNTWTKVNISDLSNVKANGLSITNFNNLDANIWFSKLVDTLDGNMKIRFGYYLEAGSISDSVFTDLLTMQLDMNGSWKLCKLNTDYTYTYENNNGLKINLLNNGDYRVSVIS